ncbi:hypothetical protein K437DRAFT_86884, partial [Tilletiaria anomala UBC 951]
MKFTAQTSSLALVATAGAVAAASTQHAAAKPYSNDLIHVDEKIIDGALHIRSPVPSAPVASVKESVIAGKKVVDVLPSGPAADKPAVKVARSFGKRNNAITTAGIFHRRKDEKSSRPVLSHAPASAPPAAAPAAPSTGDNEGDDADDEQDGNVADPDTIESMKRRASVQRNLIDINTGYPVNSHDSDGYLVNAWIANNNYGSAAVDTGKKKIMNNPKSKNHKSGSNKPKQSSTSSNPIEGDTNPGYYGSLLNIGLRKRLLGLNLGGGPSSNGANGDNADATKATKHVTDANDSDCDADDELDGSKATAPINKRQPHDYNGDDEDGGWHQRGQAQKGKHATLAELQDEDSKLQAEIKQLENATSSSSGQALRSNGFSPPAPQSTIGPIPIHNSKRQLQGVSPSTLAQLEGINGGSSGQSGLSAAQKAAIQALSANVGGTASDTLSGSGIPSSTISGASNNPYLGSLESSLSGLTPEQQVSALTSALTSLQANQYLTSLSTSTGLSPQQLQSLLPSSLQGVGNLGSASSQLTSLLGQGQIGGSTSPLSGLLGQGQGQLGGSTNQLSSLLGGSTSPLSGLLGQAQG